MQLVGLRPIAIGTLAAALALAGCGGSNSKSQTSASTPASTTTSTTVSSTTSTTPAAPTFAVSSPVLQPNGTGPVLIPASYTCDGGNSSPPITWSNVPTGTQELVLFVANTEQGHSSIDWGVAGIKPTLSGLSAGKVPAGAVVARNSHGKPRYSVCPAKGTSMEYGVALFALTKQLAVKPGFNGPDLLHKVSGKSKLALAIFNYKRP